MTFNLRLIPLLPFLGAAILMLFGRSLIRIWAGPAAVPSMPLLFAMGTWAIVNGFMSVAENNGQAIRATFKLRERLYFVKEHSLHVTQDDGVNEPSLWSIAEVSRRLGTPSVRGVGIGEDWVVIAHRTCAGSTSTHLVVPRRRLRMQDRAGRIGQSAQALRSRPAVCAAARWDAVRGRRGRLSAE